MIALITGGSGSGKSAYAENLCVQLQQDQQENPMIYIATMYPYDAEAYKKIERHRELRKTKNFLTYECFTNLKQVEIEPKDTTVLLECISNLAANEMFHENGAGQQTVEAICQGISHLKAQCRNLIIVSNEICSDGIDYDEETRRYQRYMGEINQYIAAEADLVVEVVYGIPLIHKNSVQG